MGLFIRIFLFLPQSSEEEEISFVDKLQIV
jgi:hypothetical protein